jgi:hypothetical protein
VAFGSPFTVMAILLTDTLIPLGAPFESGCQLQKGRKERRKDGRMDGWMDGWMDTIR